jgi:hypoxanthine-DNA glycosylase
VRSASFTPIEGRGARVLILGTLPGAMSLAEQRYYAQPYNAFWRIMGELVGAGPTIPYDKRLRMLIRAGVAVWDVCESAHRPGSLDSSIDVSTVTPNDIGGLLARRRGIQLIAFNGGNAAALFRRLVLPTLIEPALAIPRITLPSTSPAHAARTCAQKHEAWAAALCPVLDATPLRGGAKTKP